MGTRMAVSCSVLDTTGDLVRGGLYLKTLLHFTMLHGGEGVLQSYGQQTLDERWTGRVCRRGRETLE